MRNKWLKIAIWMIIAAPVVALIVDFTIGILGIGRHARAVDAQMVAEAIVTWLKAPATLLFLHTLFLKAIRTMPPPPEGCAFWCRWTYDLLQAYGENPDKEGKSSPTPLSAQPAPTEPNS